MSRALAPAPAHARAHSRTTTSLARSRSRACVARAHARALDVERVARVALALATCANVWSARADTLPDDAVVRLLCDAQCEERLKDVSEEALPSGLRYKDIVVGAGESPPIGYQVVVDYIAKDQKGRIFENSLEKGKPNDIRVLDCVKFPEETCPVIPGLADGLLTMRSGGIRRMYIPGELSFPKGLASAPGRPAILPFTPVTFDVALRYIPGFD